MSRWLPDGRGRVSRWLNLGALIFAAAVCLCVAALFVTLALKAYGQGAPQPVPVPDEHRLFLLGGTYPRGARVTLWTQAGHEFTGRLQGVEPMVLLEREGDCLRVRPALVYAVAGGGR